MMLASMQPGLRFGSSPAEEVVEHLRTVCTSIHGAMQQYETQQEQEAKDTETEISGGTAQPINNEDDFSDLTDQAYAKCKMAMYVADKDKDESLDVAEYVYFVSRLTYGSILVDSFDDLPVLFQTSHGLLINEHGLINVAGSAPGVTLNDAQTTRLKTICSIMDAAAQDNKDVGQAATEASTESLGTALPLVEKPVAAAAVDTEDETSDTASPSAEGGDTNPPTNTSTLLPSVDGSTIDPSPSLESNTPSTNEESADDAAGESTNNNNEDGAGEATTLSVVEFQKCRTEMLAADSHSDDQYDRALDQNEYVTLISALENSVGADSFEKLPKAFKNLFHVLQNENGEIPVSGISPMGTPTQANMDHIKSVCTDIFQVIGRLTNPQAFLQECNDALNKADSTEDKKLSKAEYAPFVYRLAFSSLTEEQLNKIKFEDLPNELKVSFELLSNYQESIDLSPESLEFPIQDKETPWLQQACNTIYDNVMVDARSSATSVRNSFVISNLLGLMASKLVEGDERDRLDKAYAAFAEEQASDFMTMVEREGRQRNLAVVGGVPASSRIDEIENSPCPTESPDGTNCMTVSGSFHLIMLNEPNPESRLELIEKISQGAIDRGAIQEQMTAQGSKLTVEGTPDSIAAKDGETQAPDPSLLNGMTDYDPLDSVAVEPGTVIVLICMSIFAFSMFLYGCVYSRRVRHKQKESVVRRQEWERNISLDSLEDEGDLGLTQKEKQRRSEERELRKSPKPLLLTQAYHLPGFSYGEDFYQYLYGSHPLFGIWWHHPLQPVSCKMRLVALLASCSFGISITNTIYLAFTLTDDEFNEEALETNVVGIPASVNNGNCLLWTAGAVLHAVYDINLWSFSTLSCCVREGLPGKVKRKEELGSLAVLLNMAAMMVIAMGTTWLRTDYFAAEDGASEVSAAGFGEAFGIEMCSNYFFFFFPLIGFVFFSGICCCCCCKECFGGRPFEVKMEQREAERKERFRKMHEKRDVADEEAEQYSGRSAVIHQSSNASNVSIRSSVPASKSSDLDLHKNSIGKNNDDDSSLLKDQDQKISSTRESSSSLASEGSATPNKLKQRGSSPAVPTVQKSITRGPPAPATDTMQNSGRGRGKGSHPGRGGRGPPAFTGTMQNGGRGRGRGPPPPGGRGRGPTPPQSFEYAGRGRGRGPPRPGRGPPPPPVSSNNNSTASAVSDPPTHSQRAATPKVFPHASPAPEQRSASPPALREMIPMNSIRSMNKKNSPSLEPDRSGEFT